jgi:hypothetical protein
MVGQLDVRGCPIRGGRCLYRYRPTSRYVLYDNGAFALQYLGFEYPGSYEQDVGIIRLVFSSDGRSDAIGTLNGELLEVRDRENMHPADFEDATYKRSR